MVLAVVIGTAHADVNRFGVVINEDDDGGGFGRHSLGDVVGAIVLYAFFAWAINMVLKENSGWSDELRWNVAFFGAFGAVFLVLTW